MTTRDRLLSTVRMAPKPRDGMETPCLEWTASTVGGYGRLRVDGKNEYAHRVAWTIAYGEIPTSKCVLHRCDNRKCVRSDHLFVGTRGDNNADMVAKGRNSPARGKSNGRSKITDGIVHRIFVLRSNSWTLQAIADAVGLSNPNVDRILRRRRWRHVPIDSSLLAEVARVKG